MLGEGEALPAFTMWVISISEATKYFALPSLVVVGFLICASLIRRISGPQLKDQMVVSVRCWVLVLSAGFLLSLLLRDWGPIIYFGGISTGLAVGSCIGLYVLFYCDQMGWFDWFRYLVPWYRKRLQHDFSHILALLLDSGIPEAKALELAAASTANGVIKQRARKAIATVRSGAGMVKAVLLMDDSKEFQWRLTNALQTEFNFVDALAGWHESLLARADRQQQTYDTLMQTSVLFFLGLIVGSIMVGMFLPLIEMMERLTW
jgi:type II secretory pathway component PulF